MFAVCFTEGECSFSINCIESCLMHSTCILRLCVASFPEMQTFIPGKGIRKTTLGVEAKDVANKCCNCRWNKDFKDFSTFAIICSVLLSQAVAQLHKSTQVKQLEYLEIQVDVAIAVTSNYIIYIYIFRIAALAAAYLKKQQAKLQAWESNRDVSEPTF